jgi:hypothetical protein
VEAYGGSAESEEGVSHSRNAVAVSPRKLNRRERGLARKMYAIHTWSGPYVRRQTDQPLCAHGYVPQLPT